jgi:GNAT superfamily N-acetyltransferase
VAPYTLRRATLDDQDAVWELLHQTTRWLRSIGSDQWSTWRTWRGPDGKIARAIQGGHMWLLFCADELVGTVTIEPDGDTDFWTPDELTEPALYVSKLAIRRDHTGQELGALLLAWARQLAWDAGVTWVRLDAWRTNDKLHAYYRDRGWHELRSVHQPWRGSGMLYQLPPAPMPPELAELVGKDHH